MKISRNNIAFMTIRSKMIRGRKIKNSSIQGSFSKTSSAAKALTLAQKRNQMLQTGNKTSASSTLLQQNKATYTTMEAAAGKVQKNLSALLSTAEKSLFKTAEADNKTDAVTAEIVSFVKNYNDMAEALEKAGGTVNNLYTKQIKNIITTAKSSLEKIGITQDKYGYLEVDEKKLAQAGIEDLKEVFQKAGGFGEKIAEKARHVEQNAETNINSLNSATYSSLLKNYGSSGNKYNFFA